MKNVYYQFFSPEYLLTHECFNQSVLLDNAKELSLKKIFNPGLYISSSYNQSLNENYLDFLSCLNTETKASCVALFEDGIFKKLFDILKNILKEDNSLSNADNFFMLKNSESYSHLLVSSPKPALNVISKCVNVFCDIFVKLTKRSFERVF
jgi:hypothetical protein